MDYAQYMRERRAKRRKQMRLRLGDRCVKCGASENLQFDHINPKDKTIEISNPKILDGPMEILIKEVDKCQLLCKTCHVDKSKKNKEFGGGRNKILNPQHGTSIMYTMCKCPECREWKKNYRAKKVDSLGRQRASD